jgi:hypothetical protein
VFTAVTLFQQTASEKRVPGCAAHWFALASREPVAINRPAPMRQA